MEKIFNVAIIGNPNCGKTTLFNYLTMQEEKIGNWAGVTVKKNSKIIEYNDIKINLIDLPGIYDLSPDNNDEINEKNIVNKHILSKSCDLVLNVIDSTNIERNLYLTTQLKELDIPVIIILTMGDLLDKHSQINLVELGNSINVSVIEINYRLKSNINRLKELIYNLYKIKFSHHIKNYCKSCKSICNNEAKENLIKNKKEEYSEILINFPDPILSLIRTITEFLNTKRDYCTKKNRFLAIRIIERYKNSFFDMPVEIKTLIFKKTKNIINIDPEIYFAKLRFNYISNIIERIIKKKKFPTISDKLTEVIDNILLNKYASIPIFFITLFSIFALSVTIGCIFQDFFDITANIIFIQKPTLLLKYINSPNLLNNIIINGCCVGISTIITFIPIIGSMLFFLTLLDRCGYISRAVFIIDRIMMYFGLSGKVFIPIIMGFSCNVPAIFAARNIENRYERLISILIIPFIPCGARLAIFTVILGSFSFTHSIFLILILYGVAISSALFLSYIFKKNKIFLSNNTNEQYLIMEMHNYQLPKIINSLKYTWVKLKEFISQSLIVIIIICSLLAALNEISSKNISNNENNSILKIIGKKITPALKPLGIEDENWAASVALITGVISKEFIIASINSLYSEKIYNYSPIQKKEKTFTDAIVSIKKNFLNSKLNFLNLGKSMESDFNIKNTSLTKNIKDRFNNNIHSIFAYLLFIGLYFPCLATFTVICREISFKMGVLSGISTTYVAYLISTIYYQLTNIAITPIFSLLWILGSIFLTFSVLKILRNNKLYI